MKTLLRFTFALLALSLGIGFAANAKKSGTTKWHNFNAYHDWSQTSCIKSVSTDTVFLYSDSAASTPFTTSTLRSRSDLISGVYSRIPDSLEICVVSKGDSQDAVTPKVSVQYALDGTNYLTEGGDFSISLGATNFLQLDCFTRKFVPDVKYRIGYWTSTATDTSRVCNVKAWAH